jgi:hypothetical protein
VLLRLPQQFLGHVLELAIFRCPCRIERGIEDSLEFRPGVLRSTHLLERLRQEEMRCRAVGVVLERAAEMLHGARYAMASPAVAAERPFPTPRTGRAGRGVSRHRARITS